MKKETRKQEKKNAAAKAEGVVFLRGKKTVLRPVSLDDVPLLQKWINDPETRQYITTVFPITLAQETAWVESAGKKPEDMVLAIEVDGKLIGTMGIHKINWIDRTAVTGAVIGDPAYRGKGYGTDAKMALLDHLFNTLNLRKVSSHVYAFNGRSARYSEKCGYKLEATLKKEKFKNGEYHDELILAVYREDYMAARRKLGYE